MRLFVAVELPKEIKDTLYEFQKDLKPFVKANFIHKKNLHLTLKFFGEIKDEMVKEIQERLSKVRFSKFNLSLDEIGFFPNEKFINIIWIGLEPGNKIIKLQTLVDEETLGYGKQESKFKAHLTLARVKSIKDKKGLINIVREKKLKGNLLVESFHLMKSELSKDGPKYSVLKTYSPEQ